MSSNKDLIRKILDEGTSNAEFARKLLDEEEDEDIYSLERIREKMSEGVVKELEPEQLIAALISDEEDITVEAVLETAQTAENSSTKGEYRKLFQKLDNKKGIGEARAGRIIASVEIARRHCL